MFELIPFGSRNNRRVCAYNPMREMEDFERAFFGGRDAFSALRTDITDNGDSYTLEADLPGFRKEDINVSIENDNLTITAERHSENEKKDKEGNLIRSERSFGSFKRSFDIEGINGDAITAAYTDGVLKLTLPKAKKEVPAARRLEIG